MKDEQRPRSYKEVTCDRIARRQFGVIAREQALRAGLSERGIGRRLAGGRWGSLHPGVYRLTGAPESWHQRVMAACLWAGEGCMASHRAAAALWRFAGAEQNVVEITTSRRLRAEGVIVHTGCFSPEEVTWIGPIPVGTVDRTLLDLGAVVARTFVEGAVTDALRRRLTTPARLSSSFARSGGRGRRGAKVLRTILDSFEGAIPESMLEVRFLRLIKRHRLPRPVSQYPIREGGRVVARIDFAYPEAKVAIEADGYRYHAGMVAWRRDLGRRNALVARGWRVIHVTWSDVEERPGEVIASLRRTLGGRTPLRGTGDPAKKAGCASRSSPTSTGLSAICAARPGTATPCWCSAI